MPKNLCKSTKKGRRTKQQLQKPARYEYNPLQGRESIRLLQLKSGKQDDPIECWLFEVCLDDYPSYEAISYAWGDPSDKSTIFCNGKTLSVSSNLVDALRILRRPDCMRILWADAACINQGDLEERSSQVQLMARVFSEASKVSIWLGHGDYFMIQVAFNYVCRYIHSRRQRYLSEDEHAHYYWNKKKVDLRNGGALSPVASVGDFTLVALEYLFTCPYFRRGWIVQEVVLAKTADIFWGSAQVKFAWFSETARSVLGNHGFSFSNDAILGAGSVTTIRRLRRAMHKVPAQVSFSKLLLQTRNQSFSDSKDYIYGLLGLRKLCSNMAPDTPLFEPDYHTTDFQCYKTATETLLIRCGDLGMLALAEGHEEVDAAWPSWVPNFSHWISCIVSYHFWSASGHVPATVSKEMLSGHDCVRVQGFCVGSIMTVHHLKKGERQHQVLLHSLYRRYSMECVAWTATEGLDAHGSRLAGRQKRVPPHLEAFAAYLDWDFLEPSSMPAGSPLFVQRMHTLHGRLRTMASCGHLFETNTGRLGRSPSQTEPGDQIVILFGGRMPFVLRPVDGLWRLVGVCYVHGIMEGEAVEELESGTKYTTQDFDVF